MCWKSACRSVCRHVCFYECTSLVGHVAYVSLTLWVTESTPTPCPTITHYLHPFSTNMQVHMHRGKRRREVAKGEREVKGGGCVQVYDNTQTDALVEKSLNCKKGILPRIHKSKYQLIRGSR